MRKIILYILACTMPILFSQCRKETAATKQEGMLIDTIRLTETEHNFIPYNLNDSVSLKDSLGNSKNLTVTNRHSAFPRMYKDGGTDASTDFYDVEELIVRLESPEGYTVDFDLWPALPAYLSPNNPYNLFRIHVSLHNSFDSSNTFMSRVDTMDFHYTSQEGNTQLPILYHTSLTILGKTYNSVYELTNPRTFSPTAPPPDYPKKLYYNKSEGIVGLQMHGGAKWCLDN